MIIHRKGRSVLRPVDRVSLIHRPPVGAAIYLPQRTVFKGKRMGYKKGARAERELADLLWARGYAVIRSAGSGNSYSPDIVAIKDGTVLAFECKAWNRDRVTISRVQMEKMLEWRKRSGAELYIAWKYPYRGWFFIPVYLLTERENSYVITLKEAEALTHSLF